MGDEPKVRHDYCCSASMLKEMYTKCADSRLEAWQLQSESQRTLINTQDISFEHSQEAVNKAPSVHVLGIPMHKMSRPVQFVLCFSGIVIFYLLCGVSQVSIGLWMDSFKSMILTIRCRNIGSYLTMTFTGSGVDWVYFARLSVITYFIYGNNYRCV